MAVLNQGTGVNVLNFYSNSIFIDIFESNSESAAVKGSICVGVAEIVGVLIAPLIGSRMGMKRIFVLGQFLQCILFGLVALFSSMNEDIALVGCILAFLIVFQGGQGSFFFAYVGEVCQDSAVSLA